MPHGRSFDPQHPQAEFTALLDGGSDEGYDAVDYQNLFLALVKPSAAGSRDIIPSFHRPELINYWMPPALGRSRNLLGRR